MAKNPDKGQRRQMNAVEVNINFSTFILYRLMLAGLKLLKMRVREDYWMKTLTLILKIVSFANHIQ